MAENKPHPADWASYHESLEHDSAPAPKQREERDEQRALRELADEIEAFIDPPDESLKVPPSPVRLRRWRWIILNSLRTHSPEEPVGYVVMHTHPGNGVRVVHLTVHDSTEDAEAWIERRVQDGTYVVHPIGQPLDPGEEP